MALVIRCTILTIILGVTSSAPVTYPNLTIGHVNPDTLIREKCWQETDNHDAYLNFRNKAENLWKCVGDYTKRRIDPISNWRETCRILKDHIFSECFEPAIEALSMCLNDNEIFFADYLKSTYNSLLKNYCVSDIVEKSHEIRRTLSAESCLGNETLKTTLQTECFENLDVIKRILNGHLSASSEEFCNDLGTAYVCTKRTVEESCSEKFLDVIDFFASPYVEWCNVRSQQLR